MVARHNIVIIITIIIIIIIISIIVIIIVLFHLITIIIIIPAATDHSSVKKIWFGFKCILYQDVHDPLFPSELVFVILMTLEANLFGATFLLLAFQEIQKYWTTLTF